MSVKQFWIFIGSSLTPGLLTTMATNFLGYEASVVAGVLVAILAMAVTLLLMDLWERRSTSGTGGGSWRRKVSFEAIMGWIRRLLIFASASINLLFIGFCGLQVVTTFTVEQVSFRQALGSAVALLIFAEIAALMHQKFIRCVSLSTNDHLAG